MLAAIPNPAITIAKSEKLRGLIREALVETRDCQEKQIYDAFMEISNTLRKRMEITAIALNLAYEVLSEMKLLEDQGKPKRILSKLEKAFFSWCVANEIDPQELVTILRGVFSSSSSPSSSPPAQPQPPATPVAPHPIPATPPAPTRPDNSKTAIQEAVDALSPIDLAAEFSDESIEALGQAIATIYQYAGFDVEYIDRNSDPLRLLKMRFRCRKVKDLMRFNDLSGQKMRYAMSYLGIPATDELAIELGTGGYFEIHVPLPKQYWKTCSIYSIFPTRTNQATGKLEIPRLNPLVPLEAHVGKYLDGEVILLPLWKNTVYGGTPGSGKSNFSAVVPYYLSSRMNPGWICMVLIDLRCKTFSQFDGIPHLWNGQVITDRGTAIAALNHALSESRRRDRILADAGGLPDIHAYNRKLMDEAGISDPNEFVKLYPGRFLPYWYIGIEEVNTLKNDQPLEEIKALDELIGAIAREGRACGISISIGCHTASQSAITMDTRNCSYNRIVFHCSSNGAIHITENKADADIGKQLTEAGDVWVTEMGIRKRRGLIAYLDEPTRDAGINMIKQAYRNCSPVVKRDQYKPDETQPDIGEPEEFYEEALAIEDESGEFDPDILRYYRLQILDEQQADERHILSEITGGRFYRDSDPEKYARWLKGDWDEISSFKELSKTDPRCRAWLNDKSKQTSRRMVEELRAKALTQGW